MRRDYDIFEKLPDGSLMWRLCVSGSYDAERKLQDLAEHSENEFFAIDVLAGDLLPFILAHGSNSRKQVKNPAKRIA